MEPMSRGGQLKVSRTRNIPFPNEYIKAIYGEFSEWTLDEERVVNFRGSWRHEIFNVDESTPMDLEIGTGNGTHFARLAKAHPDRMLIGIELKYKPMIQSIRRAVRAGCTNARMARYNAALVSELFEPDELNDVYIHFPDPWSRQRQHKHRLIQDEFLVKLFATQRLGSMVEFKTDNRAYFDWAVEKFERSPYQIECVTYDLHSSQYTSTNFITQFESIFLRQGLPIHLARLRKG